MIVRLIFGVVFAAVLAGGGFYIDHLIRSNAELSAMNNQLAESITEQAEQIHEARSLERKRINAQNRVATENAKLKKLLEKVNRDGQETDPCLNAVVSDAAIDLLQRQYKANAGMPVAAGISDRTDKTTDPAR